MSRTPGTTVTYPEHLKWEPVGPLDENGKEIFVSLIYGDLRTKGPIHFLNEVFGSRHGPTTHPFGRLLCRRSIG